MKLGGLIPDNVQSISDLEDRFLDGKRLQTETRFSFENIIQCNHLYVYSRLKCCTAQFIRHLYTQHTLFYSL